MIDAKIVRHDYGWKCRYTPTIMDGPVFRWSEPSPYPGHLEISASRNGVMLDGPSSCYQDLKNLYGVLNIAMQVHDGLKRNVKPETLFNLCAEPTP